MHVALNGKLSISCCRSGTLTELLIVVSRLEVRVVVGCHVIKLGHLYIVLNDAKVHGWHILAVAVRYSRMITNVELVHRTVATLSSDTAWSAGRLDREGTLLLLIVPRVSVFGATMTIFFTHIRLHEVAVVVDGRLNLGDVVHCLAEVAWQSQV